MKILFSFNCIDELWIDAPNIPKLGECVYYKNKDYIIVKITYTTHQIGGPGQGVLSTVPYIDLDIVPQTLKEKLCLSWRKLLKWLV